MSAYQDLECALAAAGAGVGAAECHGFLCAQSCGLRFPGDESWLEFLELRTPDEARVEECRGQVRRLLQETREQLQSEGFDFQLLLPDDDAGLPERVQALAGWCRGFLSGFGLVEEPPARAPDDAIREWLRDVEMIGRAGTGEPDAGDELALVQLTEHVRTGVMLLREDLRVYGNHEDQETWQ